MNIDGSPVFALSGFFQGKKTVINNMVGETSLEQVLEQLGAGKEDDSLKQKN